MFFVNITLFLLTIIAVLLCSFVTVLVVFFMSPKAMNERKLYSSFGELKELLSNFKIPELAESHWTQLKDVAKNVTKYMLIEGEYKGENFQKKVIQDTKNILSPLDIRIEEKYAKGRADLVFKSDIFTIVIEVKAKDVGRIQKSEFQKVEEYIINLEADIGIIVVLDSDYSQNNSIYQKWAQSSDYIFIVPEIAYYPFLQLVYFIISKIPKIDPKTLHFEKTKQFLQTSLQHNLNLIDKLKEDIKKDTRRYQSITDEIISTSEQMISKLNRGPSGEI